MLKQEPGTYNYEMLEKDGRTVWDGVHNNLALKHIRAMKKGDRAIFYHTGDEKQAVGIVEITTNPYPNPDEDDNRYVVMDVRPARSLKRPVTLAEIKNDPKFKNWVLLRISRLSVMPVPKALWDEILKKSEK